MMDDISAVYEYINRRWVEEFGFYPDHDEPLVIVMVVAILKEFHEMHCPASEDYQGSPVASLPDRLAAKKLAIPTQPMPKMSAAKRRAAK